MLKDSDNIDKANIYSYLIASFLITEKYRSSKHIKVIVLAQLRFLDNNKPYV
jgi:hypothetical protein